MHPRRAVRPAATRALACRCHILGSSCQSVILNTQSTSCYASQARHLAGTVGGKVVAPEKVARSMPYLGLVVLAGN
jgi:hypothetical protein